MLNNCTLSLVLSTCMGPEAHDDQVWRASVTKEYLATDLCASSWKPLKLEAPSTLTPASIAWSSSENIISLLDGVLLIALYLSSIPGWIVAIVNPRKHLNYTKPNSNSELSIQSSQSALSIRPQGFEQGLVHAACTQNFYHLHSPLKVSYQQILGSKQNNGTKISSRKILNC